MSNFYLDVSRGKIELQMCGEMLGIFGIQPSPYDGSGACIGSRRKDERLLERIVCRLGKRVASGMPVPMVTDGNFARGNVGQGVDKRSWTGKEFLGSGHNGALIMHIGCQRSVMREKDDRCVGIEMGNGVHQQLSSHECQLREDVHLVEFRVAPNEIFVGSWEKCRSSFLEG